MRRIYVYDPAKDRDVFVGILHQNVLKKVVKAKNIYQRNNGVGMSFDALDKLQEEGCDLIVCEIEGLGFYSSRLKDWNPLNCDEADWGHGKQYFMPISIMEEA